MAPKDVLKFAALMLFAALVALPFGGATAQEEGTRVTVELQEFEDSGISGTAILRATSDDDTQVSMELRGAELDGNHPTHIHTGTCDDFDPDPLYPLETVELSAVNREGISETTVENVSLESLREGDFVILVHQSAEELTTYLVCGEIGSGTLEAAGTAEQPSGAAQESETTEDDTGDDHGAAGGHSPGGDEGPEGTEVSVKVNSVTKTGSGPSGATESTSGTLLPIAFGALATLAALSAVALQRRRT